MTLLPYYEDRVYNTNSDDNNNNTTMASNSAAAVSAEDSLLDAAARRYLANASVHQNVPSEKDEDDSSGHQGGQGYIHPTRFPSAAPNTAQPTESPSMHPTLRGKVRMLRGVAWYDRNANGKRDSNIDVRGIGSDVEYSHGIGGLKAQLKQCDESTGKDYIPLAGEEVTTYATAITQGFDTRMVPQVVPTSDENGKYNLFINGLERWYYVHVEAPDGFLLTDGVCNDDEYGYECDYEAAVRAPGTVEKSTAAHASNMAKAQHDKISDKEVKAIGIRSGRSKACVYIDRSGKIDRTKSAHGAINFGVMRKGDTQEVNTGVALFLGFDNKGVKGNDLSPKDRLLARLLSEATVLDEHYDETDGSTTTRYLLGERDKAAIGTVTAEVLAATLDARLAESDISLDSVDPKEVIVSGRSDASNEITQNQLAVELEIKGHYSPPPELDFDYIVQDSINRDTSVIRRELRDYNTNCREQNFKVNNGAGEEDFAAVVSSNGAKGDVNAYQDASSTEDVFSTACSSGFLAPDYFETDLQDIQAKKVTEVKLKGNALGGVKYTAMEDAGGLEPWAMGPVAGIAGLIVLLTGALVFRRALGPRRVDMYSNSKNRTKNVDENEMRRFGEAGGDMDDGSVDSAFYSDRDDDSDMEETDKERKIRRKRKEKADEHHRGKMGRHKTKRNLDDAAAKKRDRKAKGGAERKSRGKLAASQGSDDTDSLGKYSNDSEEAAALEKKEKKHRKKSSSGKHGDHKSKRGRSKKSGGDNARIV